MATAIESEDREYHSQVLTCTVCQEELKKPKLLYCQHSFCTRCLVQRHDEKDEGTPFCCPTCQKGIELEDDAVESIPDNFLYDIVKEADGQGIDLMVKCTPCNEGNKAVSALHKCLDCGDALCQHCSEYHCRLTATKHHVVVTLTDLQEGKFRNVFLKRKVRYCNIHSTDEHNVPLTGYCDMCNTLVCADCTQTYHTGHHFTKIQLAREKQQPLCNDKLSNLKSSNRDQDRRIANVNKAITETKQKWNHQEGEIYDAATELHDMVDKIKDEKLQELKAHYEQELQYLDKLLKEEENKQSCLQAAIAFCEMFLENCSDADFLCHENDVMARMESSQKGLSSIYKRKMLTIRKQETESIKRGLEDVVGMFWTQEKYLPHRCKIGPVKEIFRKQVDMIGIYGLSYDKGRREIYLAGQSKNGGIYVLDDEGCFRRVIKSVSSHKSFDIHIHSQHIFYTVYFENLRKVVKMDDNGKVVKVVVLPADDQESKGQLGFMVDDDNTIYLSSNQMHRIYKWNPNDDKLSTIISSDMEHDLKCPSYLCLTPKRELVVSKSKLLNASVQFSNKEGELQWLYDGEKEGYALKKPNGICCDEEGYIYVLDKGNSRIQVLHDRALVGIIPIDTNVKDKIATPLTLTPERDLIYSYGNTVVKISFWE